MHTSTGIVGEEIERTGRSGQPLFAAWAVRVPTTSNRARASWWNLLGFPNIANDYNRCYPGLVEFGMRRGDGIQTRFRQDGFGGSSSYCGVARERSQRRTARRRHLQLSRPPAES